MITLALETANTDIGVAIAIDEEIVAEITLRASRRHVEQLHPAIRQVCELAGVVLGSVDVVAADVGPGLFTGIRVGVAAAKMFGLALAIPCAGVTSLEATRHAAAEAGGAGLGAVVPVIDLRRGDVAWQLPGEEAAFGPPSALVAALDAHPAVELLAGSGASRHRAELTADSTRRVAGGMFSSAPVSSVAVLGTAAAREGRTVDPAHLAPCYLRGADARINWTTRHDGNPRGGG